jgi:fructosamine-3-kinase
VSADGCMISMHSNLTKMFVKQRLDQDRLLGGVRVHFCECGTNLMKSEHHKHHCEIRLHNTLWHDNCMIVKFEKFDTI